MTFPADRWAARKAVRQALETVFAWGHRNLDPGDLMSAVRALVDLAVTGGGKRVSVHLADRGDQLIVTALSHRAEDTVEASALDGVAALTTVIECGIDLGPDGRQVWALLAPPGSSVTDLARPAAGPAGDRAGRSPEAARAASATLGATDPDPGDATHEHGTTDARGRVD
ncbi:hypothetical protein AB0P15_28495 [Streptomyces sp. NPDC087917]|uniref:hypothetical protein n=1 Tax=Streptomyces sp. NPDC087917 TaxID=3155060 RepID=UPI00344A39C7